MKILQINAVYGMGSTGVIVKDIHEMCLSENIESYVAYSLSNISESEIVNGYKIGKALGKKLHAILCRINGMQGYFSRCSTRKLIHYINKTEPDAVVLHNLHSNYINLNMLLKHLAKKDIRTVVVLHDCWFYTGGCFHYTAAGCDKWQKKCGDCPKKRNDTPALLLDRSKKILRDRKKHFDAIKNLTVVGVSEWIAEEAKKGIFKGRDVRFIHNGVDLDIFKPTETDFREKYGVEDKFVILGPASKWLSVINAETYKTFVNGLKEDEVLMLLGCSSDKMNALPEKVIGIPFITDRTELAKVYSAADVFVNVSREDTLAFSNIEPQACGTPVIAYKNTGTSETVNGVCSVTVENDRAEELLSSLARLRLQDMALIRNASVDWCKNNFEKISCYKKYLAMFNQVG